MKNLICFDTSRSVEEIFNIVNGWKIDYLVLSSEFFKSEKNRSYIRACDDKDSCPRVWLNIPVFCNPEYLKEHEEAFCITSKDRIAKFSDWMHFICPLNDEYIQHRLSEAEELASLIKPDIVSLDFIRQFVFWEEIAFTEDVEDGCYCEKCRTTFASVADLRAVPSIEDIHSYYQRDWTKWRSKRVADVALQFKKRITEVHPHVQFTMKLVPFKKDDYGGAVLKHAGQDLNLLAPLCDFLSPMTFYNMFAKSIRWKRTICEYMNQMTDLDVMDYCQDREVYEFEAPITKGRFATELADSHKRRGEFDWYLGTTVFHFESILKDPVRITALKNYGE